MVLQVAVSLLFRGGRVVGVGVVVGAVSLSSSALPSISVSSRLSRSVGVGSVVVVPMVVGFGAVVTGIVVAVFVAACLSRPVWVSSSLLASLRVVTVAGVSAGVVDNAAVVADDVIGAVVGAGCSGACRR